MDRAMPRPTWVDEWFSEVLERSDFRVESSTLALSRDWVLSEGAIRHRSNRFFRIVGVHWKPSEHEGIAQPLVEQREIGTLGFLIRRNESRMELLVQAKIEPGNVGIVQMAPTLQATASNASRAHGGYYPPYVEYFSHEDPSIIYDVLQSEQGTRFLGKRNRNVLRSADQPIPARPAHTWLPTEEVLDLLSVPFLVNTDARSVLVCSPWELLVDRRPFTRYGSGFGGDLLHSSCAGVPGSELAEIRREVSALRRTVRKPEMVALDRLEGWKITDAGVSPREAGPFVVRQIAVVARGREVSSWDQPIIDSSGEGRVELMCGRVDGILHFLFRPYVEAGLYHQVELGPTFVVEPGGEDATDAPIDCSSGVVRAECRQSEEGGRFFQDIDRYRILDVGEAREVPPGWYWLTLAQIRTLLNEGGWFTNEARSVLSLLLTWL